MKNYLRKLAFVAFFGMIISGCEKDLYENIITNTDTQGRIIIEDFSLKDKNNLPNIGLQNAVAKIDAFNAKKYQGRMIYDSIRNFYYDDEHGRHIQQDDKHSYTFSVIRPNNNGKIENLVFNSKQDGSFDTFLIKYDITDQELATLPKEQLDTKESIVTEINNSLRSGICWCPVYILDPRHFRLANTTGPVIVSNLYTLGYVECDCPPEVTSTNPSNSGGYSYGGSNTSGNTWAGTGGNGNDSSSGSSSNNSANSGGGGSSSGNGNNNSSILTAPLPSSSGDGPGNDADTGSLNTPCQDLKGLVNPNRGTGSIMSSIQRLKDKVNSADNNNELGFSTKRGINPDGTMKYTNTDITSEQNAQVELPTHSTIIGGGHTHPSNAYPMFSFGDLDFLLSTYNEASNGRKHDVYYMLVSKNNTTGIVNTYALKVDNAFTLQQAINAELDKPDYPKILSFDYIIRTIHKKQSRFYESCQGNYEKMFLQYFGNFGVSIYNATYANLTLWNKLELDPSINTPTVVSTPCY
jgi:hypothetical protein